MGQYHVLVNLTKKEFVDAHSLGCGVKLWEQMNNIATTPQALFALLACSNGPSGRGGGDLEVTTTNGGEKVVGRWAGDRIAVVGDYAEKDDLPGRIDISKVYGKCADVRHEGKENGYRNISDLVRPVLEHACGVKFKVDTHSFGGSSHDFYSRDLTEEWATRGVGEAVSALVGARLARVRSLLEKDLSRATADKVLSILDELSEEVIKRTREPAKAEEAAS